VKVIFFFLGLLVPMPIFYDLASRQFIYEKASLDNYLVSYGVPIPLGLISLVFVGLSSILYVVTQKGLKTRIQQNFFVALFLCVVFVLYSLINVTPLRVASLVVPFLILVFFYYFYQSDFIYKESLKGFVFGAFIMMVLHAISIAYGQLDGSENKILLFSSFFGYSIYQALVSYSAVFSFFMCTMVVVFFLPNTHGRLLIFIAICCSLFILGFGQRKAVLLDVALLLFSFLFFISIRAFMLGRVRYRSLFSVVFIAFCFLYLVLFTGFAERSLSVETAVAQRGGAYEVFLQVFSQASALQFLFGHGGGWGGYSNIFIELVLRLGVFGIVLFILPLLIISSYLWERFKTNSSGQTVKVNFEFRVWSLFFVLSLIFSNLINMNLQLPYYVINVAFASVAFIEHSRLYVVNPSLNTRVS